MSSSPLEPAASDHGNGAHEKATKPPRPVGGDCKGIFVRNARNIEVWELNYSLMIFPDGKVLEKLGIRPRLWPMSVRLRSHNA